MSSPHVKSFLFDEDNEEKIAAHGLAIWEVDQVLDNDHLVVPNRGERRAPYLLVGLDNGGACIAVPIAATHDPTMWRPVTAWRCKESERRHLEEAKRRER